MKKILLTGGSGFIGKNLRESFLNEIYEISAPSHEELDVSDTDSVDAYFRTHEFDVVLHTAVKPGHRNAPDHTQLLSTNLRMFENLARHKDCFDKFINFGSGAVYSVSADNAGVTEEERFVHMGIDEHSFCKYVVAKRVEALEGFIDLNIFGIFGKYEDYTIRFISNAICKSIFCLPVTLRQNRRFSYLDVNDLPKILEFFIENDAQYHSYNITPPGFVELEQLAVYIAKKGNVPVQTGSDGYGLNYYGSNQRLVKEFPQTIFTDIKKSIDRLYEYYSVRKAKFNKSLLKFDR